MVIIQSNSSDRSTNDIIDWLNYNSTRFFRINDDFEVENIDITVGQDSVFINDMSWSSYMYRRGSLRLNDGFNPINQIDKKGNWSLYNKLTQENSIALNSINHLFKKKEYISNAGDAEIDKLKQLDVANSVGLSIPKTILSNKLTSILNFLSDYPAITKSLSNVKIQFDYSSNWNIRMYLTTAIVDKGHIEQLSKGLPVLFQQYIKKKYELRIFYLNGEFFSMAIFSQQSEKTKIDFRNYDEDSPNRNVPFKLPQNIEHKLDRFMKSIDMNCGSIDMIYTPEGEYVFLEVNSIGQYQWLEGNCNYPISKTIAKTLINNEA